MGSSDGSNQSLVHCNSGQDSHHLLGAGPDQMPGCDIVFILQIGFSHQFIVFENQQAPQGPQIFIVIGGFVYRSQALPDQCPLPGDVERISPSPISLGSNETKGLFMGSSFMQTVIRNRDKKYKSKSHLISIFYIQVSSSG